MKPQFFAHPPLGEPGLAVFLNAGDPPIETLRDVVYMLDDAGVDCLELGVPFANSATDGPVLRRSAERALSKGIELDHVLRFVRQTRSRLRNLTIALLADWNHTVKAESISTFMARAADSGADALLLHGIPPRARQGYYAAAQRNAFPIVTTCYCTSTPTVMAEAAAHVSAYLYLVAHYGRSGTPPVNGYDTLSGVLTTLHTLTTAPIAVGFGVATRSDIKKLHGAGADAAIIGSAGVARVENALAAGQDVTTELHTFLSHLRPVRSGLIAAKNKRD